MMGNMLPMLYETIFGILALFLLTKLLGKTQISQLTAFDFIAAIVLDELVGNALFDKKAGILDIGYVILSNNAFPTNSPKTIAAIKSNAVNCEICVLPSTLVKINKAKIPKTVSYNIGSILLIAKPHF